MLLAGTPPVCAVKVWLGQPAPYVVELMNIAGVGDVKDVLAIVRGGGKCADASI